MQVDFKVTGAREIEAAMRELGTAAANRIARSAVNLGATPVVRKAKELVPVDTGELRKAIGKRMRRQQPGSSKQVALVGVEKPTSRRAHFTELGTVHQPARSFLRAALDVEAQTVLDTMQRAMGDGIQREINKLVVRTKR